jgi:hypothetical protein
MQCVKTSVYGAYGCCSAVTVRCRTKGIRVNDGRTRRRHWSGSTSAGRWRGCLNARSNHAFGIGLQPDIRGRVGLKSDLQTPARGLPVGWAKRSVPNSDAMAALRTCGTGTGGGGDTNLASLPAARPEMLGTLRFAQPTRLSLFDGPMGADPGRDFRRTPASRRGRPSYSGCRSGPVAGPEDG